MVARDGGRVRRTPASRGPRLSETEGSGRPGPEAPREIGAPARPGLVLQGGRLKAYRPLPPEARAAALAEALAAYERGDFFETHELLEPAWMGTPDELERELYQGLIKLAAAGVHLVRGNPRGMANNLSGARDRLGRVVVGGGPEAGLDLSALLAAVDERIELLAALPPAPDRPPGSPRFAPRAPIDGVDMPALPRRSEPDGSGLDSSA